MGIHAAPGAFGGAVRLAALPAGFCIAPAEEEVTDYIGVLGKDFLAADDVVRLSFGGMPLAPHLIPIFVAAYVLVIKILAFQVCQLFSPLQLSLIHI